MANNPTLDTLMLMAAKQAYNVSNTGVYNGTPPTGYVVEDLSLFSQLDRVDSTGLKLIVFKNAATGERIIAFSGTEASVLDAYADAQLGANQWGAAELRTGLLPRWGDEIKTPARLLTTVQGRGTMVKNNHSMPGRAQRPVTARYASAGQPLPEHRRCIGGQPSVHRSAA